MYYCAIRYAFTSGATGEKGAASEAGAVTSGC